MSSHPSSSHSSAFAGQEPNKFSGVINRIIKGFMTPTKSDSLLFPLLTSLKVTTHGYQSGSSKYYCSRINLLLMMTIRPELLLLYSSLEFKSRRVHAVAMTTVWSGREKSIKPSGDVCELYFIVCHTFFINHS